MVKVKEEPLNSSIPYTARDQTPKDFLMLNKKESSESSKDLFDRIWKAESVSVPSSLVLARYEVDRSQSDEAFSPTKLGKLRSWRGSVPSRSSSPAV